MGEPKAVFNILIEQELNNHGIILNNNTSPSIKPDTKIIKCFQRNISLTDQSSSKIINYFTKNTDDLDDIEFYNKYYNNLEDDCSKVGITKLELFKEVSNNLQIKVNKGDDYINIYGYDYDLGKIRGVSPELKEFDISKCNWENDKLISGNFKGCLSQFDKNDDDIINNKYVYSQYNIINNTPVFDYLYFLGDTTNSLSDSYIYNNKHITDTFKCIYNCSTQTKMNFIEKTDKNLEWYNLINKNNCNIIGLTDELNYSHREHLYNQFNLFINDVMDYFEKNKSFDNLRDSFKKIFMTDDEKFYSHVIKSFLVPYLLKDYNTINLIPKFSGSLYFGKTDISSTSNKFVSKYYVPKPCTYTENNTLKTLVFNNDNSYNSVLYAYKFDNINNMFDAIKDAEFESIKDKNSDGSYKYSNLMIDINEKDIDSTDNYVRSGILSNRVYNQKLEYNIIEPSTDEHYNNVDIYEANKYELLFNNKKEWHYNPKGYYNRCASAYPGSHENEDTCEVNDTKFYNKMTTQTCGVSGKDILGNKYSLDDIYNQKGQKIKKIGSSNDEYSVIIPKDDIDDIKNEALLKVGNDVKVTYKNIDCGKSFCTCLYDTSFDMRLYCKNSNHVNKCTWPVSDEHNALIQPYAIGDYVAYLRYLYKNMDDYNIPCVNKEISYNDACNGIGVGDTSDYISYDQYKKLFKIEYNTTYDWNAINKAEPYYLKKCCDYTGKYILNSYMTTKIKNAIIDNKTLWCKNENIDNDLFYPLKYINYSTLTYVIDDRYLYVLRYLFNYYMDELIINLINDIIQLVYENPNMYLANKLKGLYYNHSTDYKNKDKELYEYYLSMENPFNNILLYSEDSTIVPNNFIKTEFPQVSSEGVNNCLIDNNHKTKYKIYLDNYEVGNNLDSMFKDIGINYLNIASDKIVYPRLNIKNDTSALDLLYNPEKYYVADTILGEYVDTDTKDEEWNSKGFIFKPNLYISNDLTKTNNYNLLTNTTLPFILYRYYKPDAFVPKFEFKYSSLDDNVEIWYKEDDKNNTVKLGTDYIYVKEDPNTHQKVISNMVNNTEFYNYTYPPSCLLPNNNKLNYLY